MVGANGIRGREGLAVSGLMMRQQVPSTQHSIQHSVLCTPSLQVGLTVLGRPGDSVSSQPGKGDTARGQTHHRYAR